MIISLVTGREKIPNFSHYTDEDPCSFSFFTVELNWSRARQGINDAPVPCNKRRSNTGRIRIEECIPKGDGIVNHLARKNKRNFMKPMAVNFVRAGKFPK